MTTGDHIDGTDFAADGVTEHGDAVRVAVPALTLREYLVGQALAGLVVNHQTEPDLDGRDYVNMIGRVAVDIADATIETLYPPEDR